MYLVHLPQVSPRANLVLIEDRKQALSLYVEGALNNKHPLVTIDGKGVGRVAITISKKHPAVSTQNATFLDQGYTPNLKSSAT